MSEVFLKSAINWINTNKHTLQKWVLDVESNDKFVAVLDLWSAGEENRIWKAYFYKRQIIQHEVIIIGFSVNGKYVVNLPVSREVFRSPEITAHLFAELVFDYSDTLNDFMNA